MDIEHESLLIRCDCHSLDHLAEFSLFTYDNDNPALYLTVHLNSWQGVFRRLWVGFKYAFGYKSRYGNWDEMIINVDQAKKIRNVCNSYIAAEARRVS